MARGSPQRSYVVSDALPLALAGAIERSAAPHALEVFFGRLLEERPGSIDSLLHGDQLSGVTRALVAVVSSSNALARLCLTDESALGVLGDLDRPVVIDATSCTQTRPVRLPRFDIGGVNQ